MSSYEADQQLKVDSNNAKAKAQHDAAQALLKDSMNALESESVPSNTDSNAPTVLESFVQNYDKAFNEKLDNAVTNAPNDTIVKLRQLKIITTEFNAMKEGVSSPVSPDIDFSVIDNARQKALLTAWQKKIDRLGLDDLDAKQDQPITEQITARIKEINEYKNLRPLVGNVLDGKLNLSTKLPEDRLADLRKEFLQTNFLKNYKTETEQMQAMKDLKEVLDYYGIEYSDFYAFNTFNSAPGSIFITYLLKSAPNDATRIIIANDVINSIANAQSYGLQRAKILTFFEKDGSIKNDQYVQKLFKDPTLQEYTSLLEKNLSNRLNEITEFLKEKAAGTLPKAPEGSLAQKLKLAEMIPSDRIKIIDQQAADVANKIANLIAQKGDNETWSLKDIAEMQATITPLQDFLDQVGRESYNISENALYQDRFAQIKDTIDTFAISLKQMQENKQTVLPDSVTDLLNEVNDKVIPTVVKEVYQASKEKAANLLAASGDTIKDGLDKILSEKADIYLAAAKQLESFANELSTKTELLYKISSVIESLPTPVLIYLKGQQYTAVLAAQLGGQPKIAKFVKNIGPNYKEGTEFIDNQVQLAVGKLKRLSDKLYEEALTAQIVTNRVLQDGTSAQLAENYIKQQMIKKWVDRNRLFPEPTELQNGFKQKINDFFKNLLDWLKTQFANASYDTRYEAAWSQYDVARKSYLQDLLGKDTGSATEIANALRTQESKDPANYKKKLGQFIEQLNPSIEVLNEGYDIERAAQGSYKLFAEALNSFNLVGVKNDTESINILYAALQQHNNRIMMLRELGKGIGTFKAMLAIENAKKDNLLGSGTKAAKIAQFLVQGIEKSLAEDTIGALDAQRNQIEGIGASIENNLAKLQKRIATLQPVSNLP